MGTALRVLLIDSEPVMVSGIRAALSQEGGVTVDVCDPADLDRGGPAASDPDVCLVDRRLPGRGLQVVRDVRRRFPGAVVLVFGECATLGGLSDALQAGAAGCLRRDVRLSQLLRVLEAARRGEAVVPQPLVAAFLQVLASSPATALSSSGIVALTTRESQVLGLVQQGRSTASIAHTLDIAPVTVRTHLASLRQKLRARSRAELADVRARDQVEEVLGHVG